MADWGFSVKSPTGQEILSEYNPHNFISVIPITVTGSAFRTISVSGIPSGSTMEVVVRGYHPAATEHRSLGVEVRSVSGNQITYRANPLGSYNPSPVFMIYAKR